MRDLNANAKMLVKSQSIGKGGCMGKRCIEAEKGIRCQCINEQRKISHEI
jgi:hypothetical protein